MSALGQVVTLEDCIEINVRSALAYLESLRHEHDFVHPVFVSRKSDDLPILAGYRCSCGATSQPLTQKAA